MNAHRSARCLLAVACALLSAASGYAADLPAEADTRPAVERRQLSPLMTEIAAALDQGVRAQAALQARLAAATSRREATGIHRAIERVKLETEAALLRIQASHARRAGRLEVASRLEAESAAMLAPRPRATPGAASIVPPEAKR